MTEEDWLAGTGPTPLLEFVQDRTTGRRFRLFACGCYGLIPDVLNDPVCLMAVRAAERFADGQASVAEFAAAHHAVRVLIPHALPSPIASDAMAAAFHASYLGPDISNGDANDDTHRGMSFISAVTTARYVPKVLARSMPFRVARGMVVSCLRCIFNPFHPISLEPHWQTSTVLALAQGIYTDRAFDHLPILADALADAGYSNESLLNHCRSEGPHTRGCWVIDRLLRKE